MWSQCERVICHEKKKKIWKIHLLIWKYYNIYKICIPDGQFIKLQFCCVQTRYAFYSRTFEQNAKQNYFPTYFITFIAPFTRKCLWCHIGGVFQLFRFGFSCANMKAYKKILQRKDMILKLMISFIFILKTDGAYASKWKFLQKIFFYCLIII